MSLFLLISVPRFNSTHNKSIQLTKEISVQILAMSIGQALGGGALLLNRLFSPIRVDGGHDDNPSLIDKLGKGNGEPYTLSTRTV